MSKVNDAKARLGYRENGRHCEDCHHVERMKNPENGRVHSRCTLGGFATKAHATCDSWVHHETPMLAKMEGET